MTAPPATEQTPSQRESTPSQRQFALAETATASKKAGRAVNSAAFAQKHFAAAIARTCVEIGRSTSGTARKKILRPESGGFQKICGAKTIPEAS